MYEVVSNGEELEVFISGSQSGESFWDFEGLRDEPCGLLGDELWVSDSAASKHMSRSASHMLSYQQCSNRFESTACGTKLLVVGHGDFDMVFRSGGSVLNVTLHGVHHIPDLGREYRGNKKASHFFGFWSHAISPFQKQFLVCVRLPGAVDQHNIQGP